MVSSLEKTRRKDYSLKACEDLKMRNRNRKLLE
jgi:hypothetical protein